MSWILLTWIYGTQRGRHFVRPRHFREGEPHWGAQLHIHIQQWWEGGCNFRTITAQQQHWTVKVNPFFCLAAVASLRFLPHTISLSLCPSSGCQSQKHFVLIKIDKRTDKGNSGRSSGATIDPTQPDSPILGQRQLWLHFTSGSPRFRSVQLTSTPSVSASCLPHLPYLLHFGLWYAHFPFSILAYASFRFLLFFLSFFRGLSNCKKS